VDACSTCGEPIGERARFCPACGAALEQAATPGREERKLVSIIFVDLVGSTAAADGADPEVVRDVLRSYHARVKDELERFGATVEKFIGDAVMAVFGAPQSHTDDAERAVRAGLRALEAVRALPASTGGSLAARAAVATGEAVVSTEADARSGEPLAMGDVVNTAARLQTAAPVHGLVVDDPTMRATRRAVRYREIEPISAKGKAEPIVAYVAEEVLAAEAGPRRGPGPLVGRELELAQLVSTWERVRDQGRPYLVAVIGAAGAGKSRLAQEFAAGADARVVSGRSVPYEQSEIYGAFARQLKQLLEITEDDDADVALTKLDDLLSRVVPESERAEVRRCVAVLIGPAPDELVVSETAVLLYSYRRLVESVAADQPTIFVFEDVHWAEPAEYDLIRYLVQYVRDVPAMFVALTRPELFETHPEWSSGLVSYTAMPLEPLADEAARAIVDAVGGAALPSDVVERLVETAAGNPLFLEELATAVAEGAGAAGDLPTTVRAAIASRIDALPRDARTALLSGAVIGRSFWLGALSAVTGSADGRAALDVLEQRDLIRRQPSSTVPGDVEYRFKHALIRDVGYATLTRAERTSAHAAVATYLDRTVGGNPELAWLLGYHYEQAGDAAHAIRYLLAAADRAAAALAEVEAIGLLDRAERLAPDEAERVRIRLLRGRALTRFSNYDDGYETLSQLLPALAGDDLLEALIDYARCCQWTERTDELIETSERALALARELGREDGVAPALARLSQGYAMRGQEGDLARALEIGEQAMAEWVAGVRTEDRADHEHLMGDQYYWTGNYERALTMCLRARDTAVDDPASVEAWFRGTGMEAMMLASLGRYGEALEKSDALIALADDIGRPRRVYTNYSTLAYRELFDLREARARSEWVLDDFPYSSFHMPWMNAEADLVHVDVLAGEWGAALARWKRMYPQVLETPAWERWLLGSKLETFRAEMALHAESPELAVDWGTRALASTRTAGRLKYEIAAHDVLGRALSALGRGDDARSEIGAATAGADKIGNPHARLLTHAHAARVLYRLGDDDAAAAHHGIAQQVVDDVAAALSPELAERYRAAAPLPSLTDYR
jgi:class 3 adenylate cyclase/tetratricopeptide (TPR) repeat protein